MVHQRALSLHRLPWMVGALVLAACGHREAPATAAPPAPAASAPVSPAAITHHGRGLRGLAVVGKDGYGITRCGEQQQQIMQLTPSAKPFLDKFLAGGAHEFFVEAEGDIFNQRLWEESLNKLNELGWFEFIYKDKDANFSTNEEEGTVSILIELQRRETKGILRELRVLNPIPAPAGAAVLLFPA